MFPIANHFVEKLAHFQFLGGNFGNLKPPKNPPRLQDTNSLAKKTRGWELGQKAYFQRLLLFVLREVCFQ